MAPEEFQFQIHSQICQVLIPNVFIQQYWHIAQYFAQYWAGGAVIVKIKVQSLLPDS